MAVVSESERQRATLLFGQADKDDDDDYDDDDDDNDYRATR